MVEARVPLVPSAVGEQPGSRNRSSVNYREPANVSYSLDTNLGARSWPGGYIKS